MRAIQFSTTTLSLSIVMVGVLGALQLQSPAVFAQNEESEQATEEQQAEDTQEVAAEFNVPEDYSYTVKPGDGVTNLIIDAASAAGTSLSPSEAYDIARNRGSAFLDASLTTESSAPYTRNIGGFPEPGVVIAASSYNEVFGGVTEGINRIAQGETPEPAEDTDEINSDTSSDASDDASNDADSDDSEAATADEDSDLNPLTIILGVVGIAAIAYYLFGRTSNE